MNSIVNFFIFLCLTVEDALGSDVTIDVRTNSSVTFLCSISENLQKCVCPSYSRGCEKCTALTGSVKVNESSLDKYFNLSGLEQNHSGQYACFYSYPKTPKRKYRLNVLEGKNTTVVIGTVGQSITISCGTEVDIKAASEKHWCRLTSATVCQPGTIISPEKEIKGDFKIVDGSFSLQKNQLTHNDAGFYKLTMALENETRVCVVEVQVKDNPEFLEIVPVHITANPNKPFEIICRYSQNLQEFPKFWLCDQSQCPESVKSRDDRFQSALVLTLDHVACSNIKSFLCVVHMPGRSITSDVYQKPRYENPLREESTYYSRYRKFEVNAYSRLHLFCAKELYYRNYDRFDRYPGHRWDSEFYNAYFPTKWCRVEGFYCSNVKESVRETRGSVILEMCVTPDDNGAKYRCTSGSAREVQLVVTAPVPPAPPKIPPKGNPTKVIPPRSSSSIELSVGITVVITTTILLTMLLYIIYVTRCNSQRFRERSRALFTRRTPLSAVDIHADMYANSLANYYSNNQQGQSSDKQQEGNDKNDASSSDEEFEELPVRPQTSSSIKQEESDYIRVKTRGAAQSKTNTKKAATKQDSAKSVSGGSKDKEEEDEDEVTYTDVVIKPKQTPE